MSESNEIQKAKFASLIRAFEDLGYKSSSKIGQKEFRIFLNKKSSSGNFDTLLCNKLFEILNLNNMSSISISEFSENFLLFEEEVARNAESFRIKFLKEQEIYNKILKQVEKYRRENLNAEGFCKNAKISGEITDINIKKKLEGLKELIIIVIFNNKKEELHFKIGGEATNIKRNFEFRPTSRKDHFEFVMKGLNEKNVEFDIGSKIFPLSDIASQEEYFVQIVVPEMDNPDQVAAFINATIILYMSDFKYYEAMLKKQEKRLNKYKNAANKAAEYLRYVREIYGDLTLIKPELTVDFINEKLMQRKGAKLNVNFNNVLEAEVPGGNFYVEFNNQREIKKKGIPLRVEFNNSKEVLTPEIIETKKVEYSYKTTDFSKSVEKNISNNIMNKTEQTTQLIQNENNIDTNNININNNLNTNIQTNIEDNFDIKNSIQELPVQIPQQKEVKVEEEINHIKLYSDVVDSNSNMEETLKTQEQILNQETNVSNQFQSQSDLEQIFQQQQSQQNAQISGQYIQTNENVQNGEEFDIDAYLKQQGLLTETQIENNTDINAYLQQAQQNSQMQATTKTTTTKVINQAQSQGNVINGMMIGNNEIQLETKTLEPIVSKAIVNETTKEIIVSENTLPVSYLPEKVNKLIVSDQVTTLPLITAGSKVTYNTLSPIIHESKVYLKEGTENTSNNLESNNNYDYSNLISNNTGGNNANYNYQYNYSASYTNNNNDINNNNWTTNGQSATYSTTKVTHTTSQYTAPQFSYQSGIQGIPLEQGQQIQYGI